MWKCNKLQLASFSGKDIYSFTFSRGNQVVVLDETNSHTYLVGKDYTLKFEEANESTQVSSS